MWDDAPLFPEAASSIAGDVDLFYFFLIGVSVFFAVLIVSALLFFSIRYRRREGVEPVQIEGSVKLELLWTIGPLLVALVIFGWGTKLYFQNTKMPENGMDIYVTGKQWMWKIQHPQGQREINQLHVPVGETVRLTMTSEDVIHNFYVPAFRMKMDVVPGRYSQAWFKATKTGEYHLFCAEYCGTKHSEMIGTVYVLEPDEYEQWLSGVEAGISAAEAGEKLYEELRCVTCHDGREGARGPKLAGGFGTEVPLEDGRVVLFDENYFRESVLNPTAKISRGYKPVMPTFEGQVSEEQLLQLLAYVKSLSGEEANR